MLGQNQRPILLAPDSLHHSCLILPVVVELFPVQSSLPQTDRMCIDSRAESQTDTGLSEHKGNCLHLHYSPPAATLFTPQHTATTQLNKAPLPAMPLLNRLIDCRCYNKKCFLLTKATGCSAAILELNPANHCVFSTT